MKPRNLEFEELVSVLEQEHEDVSAVMRGLDGDIGSRQDEDVVASLRNLREVLLQHILDEESGVLRVLINAYGRDGSREAIEVFQEHVDILKMLAELDDSITVDRKASKELRTTLDALMSEHFRKEDDVIFPWALRTHLADGNGSRSASHVPQ